MAGFHLHSGYKTIRNVYIPNSRIMKNTENNLQKKIEKRMKNLSKNVVNAKLSDNINMPSI